MDSTTTRQGCTSTKKAFVVLTGVTVLVILLCVTALAPAYLLAFNKFSLGTLCPQHDVLVSQLLVFDLSLSSIGSRLNKLT